MNHTPTRLEEFFAKTEQLISHALHKPAIASALLSLGYSQERIEEGMALLLHVRHLHLVHHHHDEHRAASPEFYQAWEQADAAYARTLAIARVAFKHDARAITLLELPGERNRSFAGWLHQAEHFYSNLLIEPELQEKLVAFGYDSERIATESLLVETVRSLRQQHLQENSLPLHAAGLRDARLVELDRWVCHFREIARIALAGQDEHLELLGLENPA